MKMGKPLLALIHSLTDYIISVKINNSSESGIAVLKPRISAKFDAISLDTSNLTSNLTSSQTNWEYLQSISISHSIS